MSLLGKVNIRDTVRFTENDAIPIYRQIAESLRQEHSVRANSKKAVNCLPNRNLQKNWASTI